MLHPQKPAPKDLGLLLLTCLALFLCSPGVTAEPQELPEGWSVDPVTLFYLDDPVEVIEVLTQSEAKVIRKPPESGYPAALDALNAAQAGADKARGEVDSQQSVLSRMQGPYQAALAQEEQAQTARTNAGAILRQAETNRTVAESEVKYLKKAVEANPEDGDLKERLREAEQTFQRAELEKLRAQAAYDEANAQAEAADGRLSRLEARRGVSLETIKAQQKALSAAGNATQEAIETWYQAATKESALFGDLRNQGRICWAPVITGGKTVAAMIALPDSRTVVLLGPEAQLTRLRGTIEKFDRPQPQAMLNLWTLEISSQATESGVQSTNDILRAIDDSLRDSRGLMNEVQDVLRSRVADKYCGLVDPTARIKAFYSPTMVHFLQGRPGASVNTTKDYPDSIDLERIPDPARAYSLAELLLVDALAKQPEGKNTEKSNVASSGPASGLADKVQEQSRAILGLPGESRLEKGDHQRCGTELIGAQLEIAIAIRDWGWNVKLQKNNRLLNLRLLRVAEDFSRLRNYRKRLADLQKQIEKEEAKTQTKATARAIIDLTVQRSNWKREVERQVQKVKASLTAYNTQVKHSQDELLVNYETFARLTRFIEDRYDELTLITNDLRMEAPAAAIDVVEAQVQLALLKVELTNPRTSPDGLRLGHEATVNEILKKTVFTASDSLEAQILEELHKRLRDELHKDGIVSVGVLQKSSMLASNRAIARVDPRASSHFDLLERQDILQAALQLSEMLNTAGSANLLVALKQQADRAAAEEPKAQEIYALTTGNRFQIRPIIDPTGQAMRFHFDLVGHTMVRDPDGASNPQLNRIERHTVNTEVQLSNLELREISRFQSDAQLGLPEKRWGGIPVFNEIPGLQEVPFIGWFSRQWGDAPLVQQSLILAHTSIYPTIDVILRRLTEQQATDPESLPAGTNYLKGKKKQ